MFSHKLSFGIFPRWAKFFRYGLVVPTVRNKVLSFRVEGHSLDRRSVADRISVPEGRRHQRRVGGGRPREENHAHQTWEIRVETLRKIPIEKSHNGKKPRQIKRDGNEL